MLPSFSSTIKAHPFRNVDWQKIREMKKGKKEVENGAHNKSFFSMEKDFFIYSKDSWQKSFSRGFLEYTNLVRKLNLLLYSRVT